MYNSIQYFTEKVIPKIENKREKFMENPTELGSIQKETGETAYLLDDTMRLEPHVRLSEDVVEKILEKAAEESYRKAGKELGKTNKQKEWKICRCNTSKSKSVHSRTLYSACFCGKSMFLMFVDNLLPVDPQVKLHYLFAKK